MLSLVTVLPHGALRTTVPSGTFAAAALSAGSLGAFVPPSHIARLIIAQDRDKAGGRAARRLQLRCTRLGIASAVLLPAGNDFNDDLEIVRSRAPGPSAGAVGVDVSDRESVFTRWTLVKVFKEAGAVPRNPPESVLA